MKVICNHAKVCGWYAKYYCSLGKCHEKGTLSGDDAPHMCYREMGMVEVVEYNHGKEQLPDHEPHTMSIEDR